MMRRVLLLVSVLLVVLLSSHVPARADDGEQAVVRMVFFFSPTCPHCHDVRDEVLYPLKEQYGDRIKIGGADITAADGRALYDQASDHFGVELTVVPVVVIGDVVLVGSDEIEEQLPDLVEAGLAAGGVDWPDIPGFVPPSDDPAAEEDDVTPAPTPEPTLGEVIGRDMPGNAIAIGVLCGMLIVAGIVVANGVRTLRGREERGAAPAAGRRRRKKRRAAAPAKPAPSSWRNWAVPLLAVVGLAVAGYLAYVEVTDADAACGVVGDCNAVHRSVYAMVLGVPVGVLGVLGYVVILTVWAVGQLRSEVTARLAPVILLGLSLSGTAFSIYLTFLEPFVIGSTCSWCLISAVDMTLLLLVTSGPGWKALAR